MEKTFTTCEVHGIAQQFDWVIFDEEPPEFGCVSCVYEKHDIPAPIRHIVLHPSALPPPRNDGSVEEATIRKNFLRWVASGTPRALVTGRRRNFNALEFARLIGDLEITPYWPMSPIKIKGALARAFERQKLEQGKRLKKKAGKR